MPNDARWVITFSSVNLPYDGLRRTSCMTLARSVGGSIATSSGLMLTSFRTTSCSRCSLLFTYTRKTASLPVGFLVWRLALLRWSGSWPAGVAACCNEQWAPRSLQIRQRRMVDIHQDLYADRQWDIPRVGESRIVVSRCANCEPVNEAV